MSVAFEWQPRDLWIGWFGPKTERVRLERGHGRYAGEPTHVRRTVWLILPPLGLPCVPLRISWTRPLPEDGP